MDDRAANIDIVFRNGFKDYEVLPPPEVWDNIKPVIKRKHRLLFLLSRAAVITVLLSISFLAYRLSHEITSESQLITQEPVQFLEIPITNSFYIAEKIEDTSTRESLSGVIDGIDKNSNSGTVITPLTVVSSDVLGKSKVANSLAEINHEKANISAPTISLTEDFYVKEKIPGSVSVKIPKRWSIAAIASPTYFKQYNSGNDEIASQLMASEQPVMSYSGGLALSYKINKRISIQSGIYYASMGQEVSGISSFGGFQPFDNTKGARNFEVLTSSGTVYTNNADVFLTDATGNRVMTKFNKDVFDPGKASLQYLNNTLKQNFSYLELPLVLRYKLIDRSFDMNLIGGMSYNFLIDNSVYTISDGNRYPIGKTEGLSMMTLSSSIGMGMEYSFAKNISFSLEPTFRYYLNPFNEFSLIKIHPYSFGVFSGVSYKF